MYSAYHHSHPILTERLRALGYKGGEKVGSSGDERKEKSGQVINGSVRSEEGMARAMASGREL